MDVCWHSTVSRPHGYAMISRSLILALEDLGVRVSYEYLYGPGTVFPIKEEKDSGNERINNIKRQKPRRKSPHIIFGQGDAFDYVKGGTVSPRYRVGFTMLETSGLPTEWVLQANDMEEVWTPSSFNAWTFRNSGVEKPICVMPLGVDTGLFNPDVQGYPLEGVFTFLSIFEWGERKAPEMLIKAFNDTFTRDEPVALICKYNNYDASFDEVIDMGASGLHPEGGRIVFIANQQLPYEQLPRLYRSADCFVLPTRGEGWGMPILEAMACGLPVIATGWSAQQTFMTDSNSYPLQVGHLVDALAKCPYYGGFKWAEPDIGHLKELLRTVYEEPEKARVKGERAAMDVKEKWSLELCGKRVRERLEEIAGERRLATGPSFTTRLPKDLSRPRVGFDISRSVGKHVTGVGRSSLSAMRGLADLPEHDNPFEFLLLPGIGSFVDVDYKESYVFEGVDDDRFTIYRGPLPAFSDPDYYVPGLDLVHSTTYTKPETMGIPLVMTVHDLTYITHPQYHTSQNVEFCEMNMRMAVDSDCHFIAVSENTRKDMLTHYGLDPDRISVVYNGVDPGDFKQLPERQQQSIISKYDLPERFFFCIGSLEPRKNFKSVVEAVQLHERPEPLVIGGFSGWKSSELYETINRSGDKIRLVGYIPQSELPAFYNAALATVYPSLYEGFGLPVVESMACGTPVITSDNSSIPEVAGDACILLKDPEDPSAIARAMTELAEDEAMRMRFSEEGLKQAAKFTPVKSARSLVSVYSKLLGIQ